MIKDVMYIYDTKFLGWNGVFKQSGMAINISPVGLKCIPITSKGSLGKCFITIPYGNIDDVIEQLIEGKKQIEMI